MMRKYGSRLMALILVLCLVVVCVPVRAYAEMPVRPDGYTDEEWMEYLRQMGLLEEEPEVTPSPSPAPSPVTPADDVEDEKEPAPAPSDKTVEEQPVTTTDTVDDDTADDDADDDDKPASEDTASDSPEQVDDSSTEEDAAAAASETDQEDPKVPSSEDTEADDNAPAKEPAAPADAADAQDDTAVAPAAAAVGNAGQTHAAPAGSKSVPQYNATHIIGDTMDADQVTRVEYKYYTPKQTSTSSGSEGGTSTDVEEHVEYYYNEANIVGEREEGKKYFSIIETIKDGTTGIKQKVVSLWSSFLGDILNITTDAFEGSAKADGTKDTYASLSDAAANAESGQTVEMMRDYETDTSASLDKSVTVDLNGHIYTNTSTDAAITSSGAKVTVRDGTVLSNGDGVHVTDGKFSLRNIFLKSNKNKTAAGDTAGIRADSAADAVNVKDDSVIDARNSRYGIQYNGSSSAGNTLNVRDSSIVGGTGVAVDNVSAYISDSYVAGTGKAAEDSDSGAAVAAYGKSEVKITSGLFDSAKWVENIYAGDSKADITITGGRFSKSAHLYDYIVRDNRHVLISHNDGTYFKYEVVSTSYTPSRDGYRFLGYTDGHGKAITLAQAAKRGVVAYAQWKAIPETIAKPVTVQDLIHVETDEKDCTTKITVKGDTAYVTVKDADGEYVPISEVTVSSIEKLQLLNIDTIEIQVDEDVTLVLDIEEAKKNGFEDTLEVMLEKDTLLITSGEKTCIELDIAVLKASEKPVEIQLVEGELTVTLGKSSSLTVDLTKALKTGERIVVKLENGLLKLYDKYNKPIKD